MKLRITVEGQSYDVDVELLEEPRPAAEPLPAPRAIKPPPPPFGKGRNVPRSDAKTCRSPITGVIVSVAVTCGQKVAQDVTLVVIEAMKMETKILSLGAGTVKNVCCAPGDAVKPGQVLIELE